ncbi:MAG TPA: heme lyase CcmF/NrfE family subunit [Gammaproteobacteria bacterium]|nr:heme lyase CcmF/NrfE family subunit [Gammaproteobacteria bacterium]
MIPEIGHFALILALSIALIQATLPVIGAARDIPNWIALARPAAFAQALFIFIAFGCLMVSFINSDFSVLYVASNSNTQMPLIYKVSAVWGAHEGSLLLWVTILSGWGMAVAAFSKELPDKLVARVLAVLAMVAIGFLLFTLLTSNPFDRLPSPPAEGRTLNPLLQDFGLAIHPPMLYFGYVGFAVAFAFAIAALMGKEMHSGWARWARPWTNIAWMFLTFGIALGSWWAYYELGWGGWWFWDPVENASFMPWLVGTALIHSLAVTEKRGAFKAWTVLLAIFAFSLSLLGTFLVRSGVLTSVHAFASDPTRGIFILIFLLVVIGGSLALYAWRAPSIKSDIHFELISREFGLLINNVLLLSAAAAVLLGTLYPLLLDALNLGKISVGPPYFSAVFIPITAPLALLVGVGAMARWKRDSLNRLLKPLIIPLAISIIAGVAVPWLAFGQLTLGGVFGITLATWVFLTTLIGVWLRVSGQGNPIKGLLKTPRGFYGMTLAHLGIGVFIVGITLTSLYSQEQDVSLKPGESYELGGYTFTFDGVASAQGPNYTAQRGTIKIARDSMPITTLYPEKRDYGPGSMPMTEAGIDPSLTRDLYVALGEPLGGGAWAVRLYHKSFIRWIWLGGIFMGLGGLLAATDRRYRQVIRKSDARVTSSKTVVNA